MGTPEHEHDQCESDIDGFPVGSPHSPVLEDPDCDGCREEFGAPSNCAHCPYRNHPKAKPTPPPNKGHEKHCPYCGHDVDWSKPTAPLSIALPCGHEGPDDAKFCPDCGVIIEYDCESDDCNTPADIAARDKILDHAEEPDPYGKDWDWKKVTPPEEPKEEK